jgi:hypothetical protein
MEGALTSEAKGARLRKRPLQLRGVTMVRGVYFFARIETGTGLHLESRERHRRPR